MPGKIHKVVVAIAMEAEAAPFIEHLSLKSDETVFPEKVPFKAFSGKYESCDITVVTNGKDTVYETGVDNVGTVPAAAAVLLALQKLDNTDLVINAGTCGGFKRKGAEIGDVFLTEASANHDRRIPIPGFTEYGIGTIASTSILNLAESIGAKTGICTTGNSLDMTVDDAVHIESNNASVKDMESAAIAWTCALYKTPHFGLKVVTDIVDGDKPTQDEFMENLHSASVSLQQALPKIINYVCGKGHDEL
eukprot:CAMPEP_0194378648 /NCGR_PEP_ID=MMETSP0174-20130528/36699_1 /TAXON_ID=216777 /ORGANISM="Proboscia alata, Strain PI-D3" /LENGTH=248 /DNA_ID=CAMNT_0039160837 /DNA_START=130 /DNA_END=876 /DNA_ORIENTATION=+